MPLGLAACLLLAGCGVVKKTKTLFGGNFPIEVRVAPDLNENSPIAVALVVVYEKKVLEKLLELSARDWFSQRTQLERDHQGEIEIWDWEWVPGQEVEPLDVPIRVGAKSALVYADFFAPGKHRLMVDPRKPVRLLLGEGGVAAEAVK